MWEDLDSPNPPGEKMAWAACFAIFAPGEGKDQFGGKPVPGKVEGLSKFSLGLQP